MFLVPGIFAFKCVANKCECVEILIFVDCPKAELTTIPQTQETLGNYIKLSLRFNALVEVNFSLVTEQFPSVKTIDLRDNPLKCERVDDSTPLRVITDCKIAAPA